MRWTWSRRNERVWRWCACATAVLATLASSAVRAPTAVLRVRREFPTLSPSRLAHLIADFTSHPHSAPHLGTWRVLEEGGNYTWWWYRVSFECGATCAGVASVVAAAPAHHYPYSDVARHTVTQRLRLCSTLPLLSWFIACDEMEIVSEVSESVGAGGSGGGSVLSERGVSWCGVWRVWRGACRRDLAAHRELHARTLLTLL